MHANSKSSHDNCLTSPTCAHAKWHQLYREGHKAQARGHYSIASRFFTGAYDTAVFLQDCNLEPTNSIDHPSSLDCLVLANQALTECLQQQQKNQEARDCQLNLHEQLLAICTNRYATDRELQSAGKYLTNTWQQLKQQLHHSASYASTHAS